MSWVGWQRLVRKIKKGEPISYSDIEPCETKFFLLCQKCQNFSEIHDDVDGESNLGKLNKDDEKFLKNDDGESNLGKLNKDDEKFLKNYVEKKKWVFKSKGKRCAFDDVDNISEDEKEIKKQEKYEAEFNSQYVQQKPVDMYPYYKYNNADKSSKKNRTEGELKKVKLEISRQIKKGEPISYSDIEPRESKFILLPIKNFSNHDENDEETEMRKLRKLNDVETMFLKNYVEKKWCWVSKNKGKSRDFNDLDNISEDEKEITKRKTIPLMTYMNMT
ncbi:hypothetical protein C5167_037641 [Papaver somniferum]|uniref:Uncharacterized protein n=1 Tax=Papaver somniferum TaxID=3469 RepID=A0A4Y7I9H4_PAPSO|nr:uncharacterized protein LOC113289112 [Papaver somniferum]RZC44696.1 hypothetical protein C5167_037641 [Papaver somniferum]